MVTFRDLHVTVRVDDEDLQEYEDRNEPYNSEVISKYIEAVTGAEFSINIKVPGDYSATSGALKFIVRAGGEYIRSLIHRHERGAGELVVSGTKSERAGRWVHQPLVFSDIKPG